MQHSPGGADDERLTPEEVAGRELRRLRTARGWSQEQVAEQMKAYGYDWHQTQVGRIEAAQRPLRLNEAVDLAALFGISIEMLLIAADPEVDLETLEARIASTEGRLERAQRDWQEIKTLWDQSTAELARLAPRHTHAQQVVEQLQTERSALARLHKRAIARAQGAELPE